MQFFLPDYDYDYDCYSVKKTDYDYDYSEKNRNRLPNRLPIEGDYTSLNTISHYLYTEKNHLHTNLVIIQN